MDLLRPRPRYAGVERWRLMSAGVCGSSKSIGVNPKAASSWLVGRANDRLLDGPLSCPVEVERCSACQKPVCQLAHARDGHAG
jgi:hypothetical protein